MINAVRPPFSIADINKIEPSQNITQVKAPNKNAPGFRFGFFLRFLHHKATRPGFPGTFVPEPAGTCFHVGTPPERAEVAPEAP